MGSKIKYFRDGDHFWEVYWKYLRSHNPEDEPDKEAVLEWIMRTCPWRKKRLSLVDSPPAPKYGMRLLMERHNALRPEQHFRQIYDERAEMVKLRGPGHYDHGRWPDKQFRHCNRHSGFYKYPPHEERKPTPETRYKWYRPPPMTNRPIRHENQFWLSPAPEPKPAAPFSYFPVGYKGKYLNEDVLDYLTKLSRSPPFASNEDYMRDYLKVAAKWRCTHNPLDYYRHDGQKAQKKNSFVTETEFPTVHSAAWSTTTAMNLVLPEDFKHSSGDHSRRKKGQATAGHMLVPHDFKYTPIDYSWRTGNRRGSQRRSWVPTEGMAYSSEDYNRLRAAAKRISIDLPDMYPESDEDIPEEGQKITLASPDESDVSSGSGDRPDILESERAPNTKKEKKKKKKKKQQQQKKKKK